MNKQTGSLEPKLLTQKPIPHSLSQNDYLQANTDGATQKRQGVDTAQQALKVLINPQQQFEQPAHVASIPQRVGQEIIGSRSTTPANLDQPNLAKTGIALPTEEQDPQVVSGLPVTTVTPVQQAQTVSQLQGQSLPQQKLGDTTSPQLTAHQLQNFRANPPQYQTGGQPQAHQSWLHQSLLNRLKQPDQGPTAQEQFQNSNSLQKAGLPSSLAFHNSSGGDFLQSGIQQTGDPATLQGLTQPANPQATASSQNAITQGPHGAQLNERSQSLIYLLRQGVGIDEYLNSKPNTRELVTGQNPGRNLTQQTQSQLESMQSLDKIANFQPAEQPVGVVQSNDSGDTQKNGSDEQQVIKDTFGGQTVTQANKRLLQQRVEGQTMGFKSLKSEQQQLQATLRQRQIQNPIGGKSPTANVSSGMPATQKEVSQSPHPAQAMPQLSQLQSQFRQLYHQAYNGSKPANPPTGAYGPQGDGQPQIILPTQQSQYLVKSDNGLPLNQHQTALGKQDGQDNGQQLAVNLKQSVEQSRRRQGSGQEEGFASLAQAAGGQVQAGTAAVESQLQRLLGLVQRSQQQRPGDGLHPHQTAQTQQLPGGPAFTNQDNVTHQYIHGQTGGTSGQVSPAQSNSSKDNQAIYNQAQVKQGEASDVKNTSAQKGNSGQIDSSAGAPPAGGQAQQNQWMNSIISSSLGQNQITNKDLIENLKRFTQQSVMTANNNSKSQFTLPTKATGEDQSMRNEAYGVPHLNQGKDTEKNEAKLKREAHSNLAQQKQLATQQLSGGIKSDGFKQINDIVQKQYQLLMNRQPQGRQQSVSSSEIYMSCAQLQQWLQENWLIGSLIIKMIVQKQLDEFAQFKQKPEGQDPNKNSKEQPQVVTEEKQMDQLIMNRTNIMQELKDSYQNQIISNQQEATGNNLALPQSAESFQALRAQTQMISPEKKMQQRDLRSELLNQIQEMPRQVPSNNNDQFKDSKQFEKLGQLLAQQRSAKYESKKFSMEHNSAGIFIFPQNEQKPQEKEPVHEEQRVNHEQVSQLQEALNAQTSEKERLVQLLENYIKDGKNGDVQGLQQLLLQSNVALQATEEHQKKLQAQEPAQFIEDPHLVDQKLQQQLLLSNNFKAINHGQSGLGMKRSFDQMGGQNKLKIGPAPQGQVYDNSFQDPQVGLKMPNTESFDKIMSQSRLKQHMDLTQANLIDRVCEVSGLENNEDDVDDDLAIQMPPNKIQQIELNGRPAISRSFPLIVAQQPPNAVQPQELPISLHQMVTEMHDDSTPSRDKDHSSRHEESSGRVGSSSAVKSDEQKAGRSVQAPKERAHRNDESSMNAESRMNFTAAQMGLAPSVSVSSRRSNKHLTYEEQILKSLRLVIKEEDLVKIRDNIIEGIKKYQRDLGKVIIEAQLPRKNHCNTKNDFRGSKYRGPSKNRKKWQVMKMINKETVRIGAVKTELDAARIYDFLAILTEGLIAKTNFNYNVEQIQIIMREFYFKDQNSIGQLAQTKIHTAD